mmetsp:Transcript_79/g.173  ORF Transcript_79/g.173 Transcript_79/m.173 type:complete len:167 (-) Transcript_79:163-663(-)|eukprot:CAMPEP_0119056894 /NCGR_PEP_ID=MMETSP1178-20130426/1462_1 /TAXON_ID=33656 /ORGANISM="unid sp, Strain CCMP2000" /LENGTH=166 /DNA_ID=CAMNT_0007037673 /DNA_START=138 /DNA_END=638 /DNA_ORIENTATION=-
MLSLWNFLLLVASLGCCGTVAGLLHVENRRRQAQRYALIGQATEDFDEDFVDVDAEAVAEKDDDDDDGLPQLSPPPRADPRVATPATPVLADLQADLLDFSQPPPPSAITPNVTITTSENWVAEMESEIREFDQLTAEHGTPSGDPGGASWKQSMEEELKLHLSDT